MTNSNEHRPTGHGPDNGIPAIKDDKTRAFQYGLVVDPEFRILCPTPSADELAQLELSLLVEGCRDRLVAWKATNAILDGYNRHTLCERHRIPIGVVFLDLPDRAACKRWILSNQLSRRNLSPLAASYFRGTRYLLEKGVRGGDHSSGEATSHVETLELSARLAHEYRISRATIFRDATFAAAVDAVVATYGQDAKEIILARDSIVTRRTVLLMAKMDAAALQKAIEALIEYGKLPRRTRGDRPATITLPTEPKALATKLVEDLGSEACLQVVGELKKLLPKPHVNGVRRRPSPQVALVS